jgi:type II secretory pathway pseudopilin PulG
MAEDFKFLVLKRKIQNKIHFKSGFTLAEFIIVIGILLLLFTLSMRGLVNSQKSFLFNNTAERVIQLVREARSLAVTGKAQPDYTDADKDSALSTDPNDYVTPAHYGVFFDTTAGANKLILFFDVNVGESTGGDLQTEGIFDAPSAATGIGQFEAGKDVELAEFALDPSMSFILTPATTNTVMFNPIFADTSFQAALSGTKIFVFGVKETGGTVDRKRCYKIHLVAGVPEIADSTDDSAC